MFGLLTINETENSYKKNYLFMQMNMQSEKVEVRKHAKTRGTYEQ